MALPVILDLFCCQGGAGEGYRRAGFEVVGVDNQPQPRYPFEFIQDNALSFLDSMLAYSKRYGPGFEFRFSAIHASPPCQAFSKTQRIQSNTHPDLIAETRTRLRMLGLPYVIENVPGAPLRDPVMLCGAMFGLPLYRHRLFESNLPLFAPEHPLHVAPQAKMGRPPKPGEYIQPVGNFSGVAQAREAMEMPWASREGLREAIPPAYTQFIGEQIIEACR